MCKKQAYVLEVLLQSLTWKGCDNATFVNHLRQSVIDPTTGRRAAMQVNVTSAFIPKVDSVNLLGNSSIYPPG